MSIVAQCPSCGAKYQLKDEFAGRKAKCRKCGADFRVPTQIASAGQPAAAPKPAPVKPAAAGAPPASAAPKPAPTSPKPITPPPKPAVAPKPIVSASPPASQMPVVAFQPTPAIPEVPEQKNEKKKRKCPHCDSPIDADETFCKACGMAVHKRRRDAEEERKKEEKEAAKMWIWVAGAIGGAFLSAPLFFLLVASAFGGAIAMLVCLLEINLIVSIGSFALASRIFRQEPPEPGDILRIVGSSSVPANIAAAWIVERIVIENPLVEKAVGFAIGTLLAAIIASAMCMFQVGMPVWPSIFVCFSYNVLAVILTIVGYVLLGAIFAGWLVTSGEKLPMEQLIEPPAATSPDHENSDDSDDLSQDLKVQPLRRGHRLAKHGVGSLRRSDGLGGPSYIPVRIAIWSAA